MTALPALAERLLVAGLVPPDVVRDAIARQAVYGGGLDTALLEMGAIGEPALWQALGELTGLPLPPAVVSQAVIPIELLGGVAAALGRDWWARCQAVPVAMTDGALAVLCGEPVAHAELEELRRAHGTPFVLYAAPEVRLAAARQVVFGDPMPPRLVRLLARLAGAQPVRRWQAAHAKTLQTPAMTEPPAPPAAVEAAPAEPVPAGEEIPGLIARLKANPQEAGAARAALVAFAKQDFGMSQRRWRSWWGAHEGKERTAWVFEGLSHKLPEIRAAAEAELRALTGEYFGYHYDLPRREREAARTRWESWWRDQQPAPTKT
jgi:hypothetical protein